MVGMTRITSNVGFAIVRSSSLSLSSAARSSLRRLMNGGTLFRMRRKVFDELTAAGLPVQQEMPLHEETMYYAHLHRNDTAEDWDRRAQEALNDE